MEECVEMFNRTSNQTIDQIGRTLGVYQATSVPEAQRRVYADKPKVSALAKAAILRGELAYATNYTAALQRAAAWRRALRQIFSRVDFIAVPTLQKLPPKLPPKVPLFSRSVPFELAVFNSQNTPAVDFAGNPAVAIPIPIGAKTVQVTSLQLVGRRFGEADLLNAARLVESP
jgi:amidase